MRPEVCHSLRISAACCLPVYTSFLKRSSCGGSFNSTPVVASKLYRPFSSSPLAKLLGEEFVCFRGQAGSPTFSRT